MYLTDIIILEHLKNIKATYFTDRIVPLRFLYFIKSILVWPCCNGSNTDCDSVSTGSTPVGHPKVFLNMIA
jgi:hypothetical protein